MNASKGEGRVPMRLLKGNLDVFWGALYHD